MINWVRVGVLGKGRFIFDSELDEFRFPNFLFELQDKFSRPLMNKELKYILVFAAWLGWFLWLGWCFTFSENSGLLPAAMIAEN